MKLCTATAFSSLTTETLTTAVHPWVRASWHEPKGDIGVQYFRYRGCGVSVRVCIHLCGCCTGGCARAPEQGVLLRLCTITTRCWRQ